MFPCRTPSCKRTAQKYMRFLSIPHRRLVVTILLLVITCAVLFIRRTEKPVAKDVILQSPQISDDFKLRNGLRLITTKNIIPTTTTRNPLLKNAPHEKCHFLSNFTIPNQDENNELLVAYNGDLGNNLFQYASSLGIAEMTGKDLIMTNNTEFTSIFPNIKIKTMAVESFLSSRINSTLFCEEPGDYNLRYFPSQIELIRNWMYGPIFMKGYMQSFRYFDRLKDRILHDFQFSASIKRFAASYIEEYRKLSTNYLSTLVIGIHIRRGDMVNQRKFMEFGYIGADPHYIKSAMDYFISSNPTKQVLFIVGSNDYRWSKRNLGEKNIKYLTTTKNRALDMCILSMCDGMIMTVGTFGWWSSYFNKGTVVYQNAIARPNTTYFNLTRYREDVFPSTWMSL